MPVLSAGVSGLAGVRVEKVGEYRIVRRRLLNMRATGFPCPLCGWGVATGQDHAVLERIIEDGYDVGMRLYCMSCEHVWDEHF